MTRAQKTASREDILSAAAKAMARSGFHGMTMRELARETGLGLATAYAHFASKEHILFELQEAAFVELVASAERAVEAAQSPEDALCAFVDSHVAFVAKQPEVMRVLVLEAGALSSADRARIRSLKDGYFEVLRRIVQRLTGQGDAAVERTTYVLFGMLNWTFGWYDPVRHGPARQVSRTICEVALSGLGRERKGGDA